MHVFVRVHLCENSLVLVRGFCTHLNVCIIYVYRYVPCGAFTLVSYDCKFGVETILLVIRFIIADVIL